MADASETSRSPYPSRVVLPDGPSLTPTLLDFLVRRFPRVDRRTWAERLSRGWVHTADGQPLTAETPYSAGLEVCYYREVAAEPPIPEGEDILFEDDHLLAADKPPFQPVVPAGPWVNSCLLFRLRQRTGCVELAPVHRLDLETAGVVLFAKTREARRDLGGLFARGKVRKLYRARSLARRAPRRDHWHIASHLTRGDPWFRMREVADAEPNARTDIRLLSWQDGRARFELEPLTGKKHQLRLHLASLGYPIENDRLYPQLRPGPLHDPARPLALLAYRLKLHHPHTGEPLLLKSLQQLTEDP